MPGPIVEPDLNNPPEPPQGVPAPVEDLSKSKSNKYVQWTPVVGDTLHGSHRVVYGHEWKAAGIEKQGDVTWGPINGYRVPVESLSADAKRKILTEAGFTEVELDKDGNVKG